MAVSSNTMNGTALLTGVAATVSRLLLPSSVSTNLYSLQNIAGATVRALLNEGVRKVVMVDMDESALQKFRTELVETYPDAEIEAFAVDVSNEQQVDGMVARAVEKFGRIDYCLNAAGLAGGGFKLGETSLESVSSG